MVDVNRLDVEGYGKSGRSTTAGNEGILPKSSALGKDPFISHEIEALAHSRLRFTVLRPQCEEVSTSVRI